MDSVYHCISFYGVHWVSSFLDGIHLSWYDPWGFFGWYHIHLGIVHVCVCACARMSWDVHPYLWWSTLRKMGWKQVVPTKQNWVQIMTLTSDIPPGHHLSNSVFIFTKCSCNFLGVIQNCIFNWFSHIFRSSSFPGGSQPTSWNHVVASVPRCYRSALWWSCGSSLHSARHVAVLKVMEVAGEDVNMSIVF